MYRRGFSVNTLRYRAQSLLNRARRARNPWVWAVGVGCLLIIVCLLCVGLVAFGIYLYLAPATVTSGSSLLLSGLLALLRL